MMDRNDNRVAISRVAEYDVERIKSELLRHFELLKIDLGKYRGKNVVIKPNLVMKTSPDKSATTHPTVVEAIAAILCEVGANVTIAESPGGIYNEKTIDGFYRTCGIADIATRLPIKLNYDTSSKTLHAENSATSKVYDIITPICDADCIINVAKLKTHTFMMMSAAVKNLFGSIPGTTKFEMHARFTREEDFAAFINDLTLTLCEKKDVFHIVDAVSGMQGNGPTGGTPLEMSAILSGVNPYAVDTACMEMLSLNDRVIMQTLASRSGLCPRTADGLTVLGGNLSDFKVADYTRPDTLRGKKFTVIPEFLSPRPVVDKSKCVGCGECAANCPVSTIDMVTDKRSGKKRAQINRDRCIKCYCCQELCHFKAVAIKKSFIYSIIK